MILQSTLNADSNNETSLNNRVEPDDEEEDVAKKVR